LDKNFESKSIKEKIKHVFNNNSELNFQNQLPNKISYQTAPISSNPYITQKLNNMDEAKVLKEERRDWTRIYHKMLKGIEVMIDI